MNSNFRKYFLVVPILIMSALLWAQHKTSSAPAPKAPAPHASAPAAKPSAPQSHSSAPTHTTTPSHATAPSTRTTTTSRTTTPATHTNAATHTNTTTRGTTTSTHTTSNTHTTAPASHTTAASHAATPSRTSAGNAHTPPGHTVSLKGGGSASVRPNGQIRSINRNGMQINHSLHGGRTIVSTHNGARVVTTGRHGGYVQRAYVTRGGHSYYSRTYYYHGAYRVGVYRGYYYGGYNYYGYYHPYWYGPAYYGWAYNPWPAPIAWGWGWGGAPWYGYYGAYWNPYPFYAGPSLWLTDYLIAANLQAAYAAQAEANAAAAAPAGDPPAQQAQGPVQLSPEVKQAIADEVKAQIQQQQADAAAASAQPAGGGGGGSAAPANAEEVPPALNPAHRTFVVSQDLDVVADGQECALTQGDVITRLTDTPDQDQKVNVSIASSKKTDCAAGKTVLVSVDDLQEMHNHFQEQLDAGLKEMAAKQGTGGMPKSPDTKTTASNVPPPPADQSAGKALDDQEKSADQTESQVKQETASGAGGSH